MNAIDLVLLGGRPLGRYFRAEHVRRCVNCAALLLRDPPEAEA